MIAVSIVLYNTLYQKVEALINGLLSCGSICHLYIIDNSATKTKIPIFDNRVEYIFNNKNIGFGAAHNIALLKSIQNKTKYHIIINPDIELEPIIIDDLKYFMEGNIHVGLVMPKVLYPNGEIQYLCKLLPTPFDWIFRRFLPLRKIVEKRNNRYELRDSGYNKIMNIPYLSGCFMFFRVHVLEEIGVFDESIFMYGEDTDITRRIHHKYETLFYPHVSIVHQHNKESYRNNRLLWIHIKSAFYYFNKWGWFFDKERRTINKKLLKDLSIR